MAKRKWARALRRAAARGDVDTAARLLREVRKWRDVELQRALNACTDVAMARTFAAHAPDFFADGGAGIAVMGAAAHGREATLRALLETGEVDAADGAGSFEGETPLHAACEAGHASCVEVLLQHGADPHVRSSFEWAPLHWAAHGGSAACARVLLRWGADLNVLDTLQRTPLHWAASCGYIDVLQALLDAGADVTARDYIDQTALHLAAPGVWEVDWSSQLPDKSDWEAPTDHTGCIAALVRHAADLSASDQEGKTALMVAAQSGHTKAVVLLRELGADMSSVSKRGETVLHLACQSATLETIVDVLDTGFDIHCRMADGSTPLHVSASQWNTELCVSELVRRGAVITARDDKGRTPLHLSASRGRPEGIDILLRLGADINVKDFGGKTPLHRAAASFECCVGALLRHGAVVDVPDAEGRTPLHDAVAVYPEEPTVRMLLVAGANPMARDAQGRCPIDVATTEDIKRFMSTWARAG